MARKDKPGISYYAMDVDHVHNKKIKLLVNEFDSHGYWIYQCLLASIYQNKGYYLDISDEDTVILFASDVCKKPVTLVREVIECCVRRELFSREIFNNSRVLTSDRIQENYLVATYESRKKGREIRVNSDYWLLETSENEKGIVLFNGNSREIQSFSREKVEDSPENGTQRKGKEIKEKEIKLEKGSSNKFSPPSQQELTTFFIEKIPESSWSMEKCHSEATKFINFYDSKNWYIGKNKMSKWKSAASGWISRERELTNGKSTFKPNNTGNAVSRPQVSTGKPYTKL